MDGSSSTPAIGCDRGETSCSSIRYRPRIPSSFHEKRQSTPRSSKLNSYIRTSDGPGRTSPGRFPAIGLAWMRPQPTPSSASLIIYCLVLSLLSTSTATIAAALNVAIPALQQLNIPHLISNPSHLIPEQLESKLKALHSNLSPLVSPAVDKLNPFHNLQPDAYSDPVAFIRSRGFIPESHQVTTKDGYIITLHRIINPAVPPGLRDQLKPVLLQHGLFTSSFNFIINSDRNNERPRFDARDLTRTSPLEAAYDDDHRQKHALATSLLSMPGLTNGWSKWLRIVELVNDMTLAKLGLTKPSNSFHHHQRRVASGTDERNDDDEQAHAETHLVSDALAFEMANQGYDVWMGNSRGSTYSLNHTHFDYRHDWRYWDFSFHEIGLYDLPACIDYILAARNRRSLAYVGHSQGNLAMFILQSLQPEWANKVKPFIALSPVAFIPNVYYGAIRALVKTIESTLVTTTQLNRVLKGQLLPASQATSRFLDIVCVPKWSTPVCNLALSLMLGDNLFRSNSSLTPVIAHHIPEGTSVLNVLHFAQLIESGQFRAFDFGPRENLRRHGTLQAPFYPVRNIRSPDIAFISGRTDVLSTMRNVELTRQMLRVPLMDDYVVPELVWGHADHMYAMGAGQLVNAHLIGLVDRYRLVD